MSEMSSNLIVLITAASQLEAETIANTLVEKHLAACVNIVAGITSVYIWNDSIQKDSEMLLICKSNEKKYQELEKTVSEIHSYENPEIICTKIHKGSKNYIDWLNRTLTQSTSK